GVVPRREGRVRQRPALGGHRLHRPGAAPGRCVASRDRAWPTDTARHSCRAVSLSTEGPLMRLAAQMRGGVYPAPPEAVAHAATFLRPPTHGPCAILDPCAGEGAAIRQLGEALGCPPALTFAIELDDSRAERLRAALPGANVLAPANFFGCRARQRLL